MIRRASCKISRLRKIDDFEGLLPGSVCRPNCRDEDILEKVGESRQGQGTSKGRFCVAKNFTTGSYLWEKSYSTTAVKKLKSKMERPLLLPANLRECPSLAPKAPAELALLKSSTGKKTSALLLKRKKTSWEIKIKNGSLASASIWAAA